MGFVGVLTTIQPPTKSVLALSRVLTAAGAPLIVIGDRKGPDLFDLPGARFYDLKAQRALPFSLAEQAPVGHYSRKNLGYLLAIAEGTDCIYETDDDNVPLPTWQPRSRGPFAAGSVTTAGWVNTYALFTDTQIWPRGLPLQYVRDDVPGFSPVVDGVSSPVQQGLANGSPDVDAVWRLVLDREVTFDDAPSALLPAGTWCPFNSQSTWWWSEAFPLLYLPSYCSFRMTDIWRSFVAQRCLWAMGDAVAFHAAEVWQDRNEHRLIADFEDEVPGYLHNAAMCEVLEALDLPPARSALPDNVRACYEVLVSSGWIGAEELPLLDLWLADVSRLHVGSLDID